MLITRKNTESHLQIYGPRRQSWRPASSVHGVLLSKAIVLAQQGLSAAAIQAAEDAWVAGKGGMHGVCFRVVTKSEQFDWVSDQAFCDDPRT